MREEDTLRIFEVGQRDLNHSSNLNQLSGIIGNQIVPTERSFQSWREFPLL